LANKLFSAVFLRLETLLCHRLLTLFGILMAKKPLSAEEEKKKKAYYSKKEKKAKEVKK
jgi:hypothetical protein